MMPSNPVYLPLLLAMLPAALGQTVTLSDEIPSTAHKCVGACVQDWNHRTDIGSALQCGDPYEEDCFCATGDDSLKLVSEQVNNCASSSCSAGDLTKDISIMRSLYGSYCRGKGYTQDLIEGWYTAADGPETDATTTAEESTTSKLPKTTEAEETSEENEGQPVETSTELTVATQTRSLGEPEDDGASLSRVIVSRTSIFWVDNTADPGSSDGGEEGEGEKSGVNTTALGAGLGVGVPLALALVGAAVWFCVRSRRKQEEQQPPPLSSTEKGDMHASVPNDKDNAAGAGTVAKVVEVQGQKLELAGQGVRRELAGQQIHPFLGQTDFPAVSVPGHHEMIVENRPHGMQAHHVRASERHELPGY